MKEIKVKLIGDGSEKDPFNVDLPTWIMKGSPDFKKMTAVVLIPDNETTDNKIDQQKIREKYKGSWTNFNKLDVEVK